VWQSDRVLQSRCSTLPLKVVAAQAAENMQLRREMEHMHAMHAINERAQYETALLRSQLAAELSYYHWWHTAPAGTSGCRRPSPGGDRRHEAHHQAAGVTQLEPAGGYSRQRISGT
jgi:hypothetical protein